MKRSWKTTTAGVAAIAGGVARFALALNEGKMTEEAITTSVTAIMTGVGLLFARDNDVSSEEVGIKEEQPKEVKILKSPKHI